jgi:hypothetical protein
VIGQAEIYWRDGGYGVNAQRFGMGGEHRAVACIVAGDMGDDDNFTPGFGHDGFQYSLAFGNTLVNAFPR